MTARWKPEHQYPEPNKRLSTIRFAAETFQRASAACLIVAMHIASAWASSGVAPFWLYDNVFGEARRNTR
jgi:hypothetical protein